MKHTKLILATLITLAMLVPAVNAAPLWSDEWFIEHAENYVNTEYTDLGELDYEGEVISGWEASWKPFVQPNKEVELYAEYEDDSFYDLGSVSWNGRVYWYGGCYTYEYVDTAPTLRKMFYQQSVYLDLTVPTFWDGEQWRTYEPVCYRNDGSEPIEIHFTLFGYDKTYIVKPGYSLDIYTPYNNFF